MSNTTDDNMPEDWTRAPNERSFKRMGKIMTRVAQGAEAQKSAARTVERNARYMLWTAALAALSTAITTAGVIFCVIVYLTHMPH